MLSIMITSHSSVIRIFAFLALLSSCSEVRAQDPTASPSGSLVPTPGSSDYPSNVPSKQISDYPSNVPSTQISDFPSNVPSGMPIVTDSPTPFPECISNATMLQSLISKKNPFVLETYVICPNTHFQIGFPDSLGKCCIDGDPAIPVRSNLHILCGEDGSSKNNCTLAGGQYQVISSIFLWNFESTENFLIKGITFREGDSNSLLLNHLGNMVFEDCIFDNHEHTGVAQFFFVLLDFGRRRMAEYEMIDRDLNEGLDYVAQQANAFNAKKESIFSLTTEEEEEDGADDASLNSLAQVRHRQLQFPDRCLTIFRNCTFNNNRQGPRASITRPGIMTSTGANIDIIIEDSLFTDNAFTLPPVGYAIEVILNNNLVIKNTCFMRNDFIGVAPILFNSTGEYELDNNYGDKNNDSGLLCEFLTDQRSDVCETFDASECERFKGNTVNLNTPSSSPRKTQGQIGWLVSGLVLCIAVVWV